MKNKLIMLAFATIALTVPQFSHAEDFTVTKFEDTADGDCSLMDCSLREAIVEANGNGFDDKIILGTGTYTLSLATLMNDPDTQNDGDLDIAANANLTIVGNGPGLTIIDADGIDRVFEIKFDTGNVEFDGFAITGGDAATSTEANCIDAFSDGTGNLTLRNLYVHDNGSDATIGDGCIKVERFTQEQGVVIERSTISNNIASDATLGGGVQSRDSNVRIVNSTISGNKARVGGGLGLVGTLDNSPSKIEVFNSTIYDNTAALGGGGAASSGPGVDTSIIFSNTIISGNHAGNSGGVDCLPSIPAYFESLGYNIVGNSADCEFPKTKSDQLDINVVLPPLADNGGGLPTHEITADSLALNAGNPDNCNNGTAAGPSTDERGEARIFGPACDVGAYESNIMQGTSNLKLTKEADKQEVSEGDTLTYTLTLVNNGPNKSLVTQVQDELPPELDFVSATSDDNTDVCNFDANTHTVTCDLGTVNVLEPVKITIVTKVNSIPQDKSIDNTASASSSENDPDATDNTSSANTTANGGAGFVGSLSGGANAARIIGCMMNPLATGFDFSAMSWLGLSLAGLLGLRIRRN